MKYRYFMLPFIIIFFMILVIDYNSEIVNKVLIDSNRTINYPFFDNDNIDLFIENYLNRTSNNYSDDIFIDYDGYLKENKYYLSFYKYIVGSGKISNDIDKNSNNRYSAKRAFLRLVKDTFDKEKIEIPYTTVDINVRK